MTSTAASTTQAGTTGSRRVRRSLVGVATVGAIALVSSACTPDTTGQRVESDFAQTFTNSYIQSRSLQGKPPTEPDISSTDCHNGTNKVADAGPGSWSCEIKYVDADGDNQDDTFIVLVEALLH